MSNPFELRHPGIAGPALDILPVTPSNTVDLPRVAIALYVTGAGNVVIDTVTGTSRTVNLAANSFLPVGVRRVHATGTTATGIHALVV